VPGFRVPMATAWREQEMGEQGEQRRYGGVEGVFVPTLVTILGTVLFLRTGWVAGNAGVAGSVLIIVVAFVITGCAALSLASFSTNNPPGEGGVYAAVGQSLGVEAAGAVGLPLYLAKSTVVAFYVFGFRDGWARLFPGHPELLVDLVIFAALVTVTLISTRFAFRTQYATLAAIALAVGAVWWAGLQQPLDQAPPLFGDLPGAPEEGFPGTTFWVVFAVFFPATVGLESGVSMSGELRNPRRALPLGVMAALGISFVVYLSFALILSHAVPTGELIENYLILVDFAWSPAVYAGLLAATFSSALASLVGAPRILQALAHHDVPPKAAWLAKRDRRGEPKHALIVTLGIVLIALLARRLQVILPLITLFFLSTYASASAVALLESTVGLASYRPTLRLPRIVPAVGLIGSVTAMTLVHAAFTVVAAVVMLAVLVWLFRRRLDSPWADMRGAAYAALARWAARKAVERRTAAERAWVPHWLVPVRDAARLRSTGPLLTDVARPHGAIRIIGIADGSGDGELPEQLAAVAGELQDGDIDISTEVLEVNGDLSEPALALRGLDDDEIARPNLVLVEFPTTAEAESATRRLLAVARNRDVGVALAVTGPADRDHSVTLWLSEHPSDWQTGSHLGNADLALLLAYRISRSRDVPLQLFATVTNGDDVKQAEEFLRDVAERARLDHPVLHVVERVLPEAIVEASEAGLHVLPLPDHVEFGLLRRVAEQADGPFLFVRDSGIENAFA
jgi:solute carrier family 12 (sodium/potassium/chloride transporter), member 2